MQCFQLMKAPVFSCESDDTVAHCAQVMASRNIGFVPVLDGTGRPCGVVTDRDLAIRVVASQLPPQTPVHGVMTKDVVACRATDPLFFAEEMMAARRMSRLVVLDETGRCVGVLSLSDMAHAESGGHSGRILTAVTEGRVSSGPHDANDPLIPR